MRSRILAFSLFSVVVATAPVDAQPPTQIEHQGVACIVVEKYPRLKACFGSEVLEPRAYFHAQGDKPWYYVKMLKDAKTAPEPGCYAGILPRPTRKLLNRHVEYYLESVDKDQRTPEYDPLVVRRAAECKKDAPVAPISPTGPVAVFPVVPATFAMGAFPTVAVGVTAGTIAAGTGVYFATKKDETTTPSTPVVIQPPAPPAPVPPPPPPPTPPPPPSPLELSCQADPRSGEVPLTVSFTAFASGATGAYDYEWRFGDGATHNGRHPVHTYTSTGAFGATLIVRSGDQVRRCERPITVTAPPPKASPTPSPTPSPSPTPTPTPTPSPVTLTFTSEDDALDCSGPPSVNIDPPDTDCVGTPAPGTTCSEIYPSGTVVTITSSTTCGSQVCWSGACFGTSTTLGSACTLSMDADKIAGARFVFGSCMKSAERPVGFAWNLDLDAPGALGQAVVDGAIVVAESGRRAQAIARDREGEAVVAATLVKGAGKPGTWRFQAQEGEALEPGSLRVLRGDVALLTPTAVVFRLKGVSGEQFAFSYRLRR
jgi:PKD repeat protein